MSKSALISGVAGQDGSYLVELLASLDYQVHGFDIDRQKLRNLRVRIGRSLGRRCTVSLYHGDVTDRRFVASLLARIRPQEAYNLAAQSRVDLSFNEPELTARTVTVGVENLLSEIVLQGLATRLFQASTAEMFGDSAAPQTEVTAFRPLSPYAAAKAAAHGMVIRFREQAGVHASAGIMFNHESSRRPTAFVSRKITSGVAAILAGRRDTLDLGNLDAARDWGHAKDYTRAMWLMLQSEQPEDYVLATGVSRSVATFASYAFDCVGLNWWNHVRVREHLTRIADPPNLCGDASLARARLGWEPLIPFRDLVLEMLQHDLRLVGLNLGQFAWPESDVTSVGS
jgi:GDPmannose 4,6-dehydratase